jgi:transposase
MMRVGLYKAVHVKALASQQERALLTSRKLLRDKLQDIENELRGTLRNFGLKVEVVNPGYFEGRVREGTGDRPLEAILAPLLVVRRALREQLALLHKMVLDEVRSDRPCRRLMTGAGTGTGSGADLSGNVQSAAAFWPLQGGRSAFRLGTAPLSVRRDGLR